MCWYESAKLTALDTFQSLSYTVDGLSKQLADSSILAVQLTATSAFAVTGAHLPVHGCLFLQHKVYLLNCCHSLYSSSLPSVQDDIHVLRGELLTCKLSLSSELNAEVMDWF